MYLNTIFYWKTKSIFDLFSQEIAVTSEAIKKLLTSSFAGPLWSSPYNLLSACRSDDSCSNSVSSGIPFQNYSKKRKERPINTRTCISFRKKRSVGMSKLKGRQRTKIRSQTNRHWEVRKPLSLLDPSSWGSTKSRSRNRNRKRLGLCPRVLKNFQHNKRVKNFQHNKGKWRWRIPTNCKQLNINMQAIDALPKIKHDKCRERKTKHSFTERQSQSTKIWFFGKKIWF